jgi:hypothetical protein
MKSFSSYDDHIQYIMQFEEEEEEFSDPYDSDYTPKQSRRKKTTTKNNNNKTGAHRDHGYVCPSQELPCSFFYRWVRITQDHPLAANVIRTDENELANISVVTVTPEDW